MTDLEDFQKAHGPAFYRIVRTPAFLAAMQFLNQRKVDQIAALTDEQIEANGKLLLADFRGHLNHENDLMALAVVEPEFAPDLGDEIYMSPEEEADADKKPV